MPEPDESEVNLSEEARLIADQVDAPREEVENRLRNLLDYSVPIDEAKRTIRRRYEAETQSTEETEQGPVDIAELDENQSNIALECRILTQGKRVIPTRNGDTTIIEGELGDDTGSVNYTSWRELSYRPGDSVRITNAETRSFKGELQVSINNGSNVSGISDVDSVDEPGGDREIADLSKGDSAVNLDVKIVDSEQRTIEAKGEQKQITSGVIGDESGALPFTDWNNRELTPGEAVHIRNASVQEYMGLPQLNLHSHTDIQGIDRDVSLGERRRTIAEAVRNGGEYDVVVEGDIIEVRDGSGLIKRCPRCNRPLQKGRCNKHGDVEGNKDLRIKAIVDDGTAAANLILDNELTQRVTGASLEDAVELATEAMDRSVVATRFKEKVMGKRYRIRGNITLGDYGANMQATEIREIDIQTNTRAKEILDEYI